MKRSLYKSFVVVFLSTIWVTGIISPPVLQLFDDSASFLSFNLNEEEPQEQEKKDSSEEFTLGNPMDVNDFVLFGNSESSGNFPDTFTNSYYGEIQLPPPERVL